MHDVLIVVLSFNGTADTLACLESLTAEPVPGIGILIVDNASTDGAPAAIRARFPDVEIIELSENLGWAGGNNVGIRIGLERGVGTLCLLNNDTQASAATIAALAAAAPGPCLMHPAIDFADPAEGPQLDPSIWTAPPARQRADGLYELDYAYGACLLMPAEVFRRIGLFDERFFLQLEETDFFLRARAARFPSLCLTTVRIVHAESRAFGGRTTPAKTYYFVRNTLLLARKHVALAPLQQLYHSLARLSGGRPGAPTLPRFLLSTDPFARAVRLGVWHWLGGRFGRLDPALAARLNAARPPA